MFRAVVRAAAALLVLAAGALAWSGLQPYDPEPWLADFVQVRRQIGAAYANLDWKITHGGIDPYRLAQATDSAIRQAGSDRQARKALIQFVDAFEDDHLRLHQPRPWLEALERRIKRGTGPDEVTAALDAPAACRALGIGTDDSEPLLAHLPGYQPLATDRNVFAAGMLPGERPAGILRIPLFSARAYRPACERAWPVFRATLDSAATCGEACRERFEAAVYDRMTIELAERVDALERAGARLLVIDITGNGGGSNWVDPAARTVTRRTLRSPRVGFVRHAHWVPAFQDHLALVEQDLARHDLDEVRRGLLTEAQARLVRAAEEASTPCDLEAIWTTPAAEPGCVNIGSAELYSTGVYGWLAPAAVAGLRSADALFWPAAGGVTRGVGTLPIVVLADRHTASAAEYFAAMLRDNDAARVIGERTVGVGCGYTNGGISMTLPHSGLELLTPDCLRLRADGTNEVAGIAPDVPAEWRDDDGDAARAAKARAALDRLDWPAGISAR